MDSLTEKKLKRGLQTLFQMCQDRGKNIKKTRFVREFNSLTFGEEQDVTKGFEVRKEGLMANSFKVQDLLVLFLVNPKKASISAEIISTVVSTVANKGYKEAVFVTFNQGVPSKASSIFEGYRKKLRYDLLSINDLVIPPHLHTLQMKKIKHYRNGKKWAQDEQVDLESIPALSRDEILCVYYGVMPGEVLTGITLGSGHETTYSAYRID